MIMIAINTVTKRVLFTGSALSVLGFTEVNSGANVNSSLDLY